MSRKTYVAKPKLFSNNALMRIYEGGERRGGEKKNFPLLERNVVKTYSPVVENFLLGPIYRTFLTAILRKRTKVSSDLAPSRVNLVSSVATDDFVPRLIAYYYYTVTILTNCYYCQNGKGQSGRRRGSNLVTSLVEERKEEDHDDRSRCCVYLSKDNLLD